MNTERDKARSPRRDRHARGGVLVEFALMSFVVWMLLAGVLEIGRALTAQQLIQHAARTLAREMAELEFPANFTFDQAIEQGEFRSNVIDTRFLVIDSELLGRCGYADFGQPGHEADLDTLFDSLPIGNRLLRPLMISDEWGPVRMIRYPGALLRANVAPGPGCLDAGSNFAVGIAELDSAAGVVTWHAVIEQHGTPAAAGVNRTGFALSQGGWVGLRVNYPFQSAGMLAARPTGVIDPRTGRETQELIDADVPVTDFGLAALNASLIPRNEETGAYAGSFSLGRFYAMPDSTGTARAVRPFRRILTATAGFRRQIFGGAS